MLGHQDHLRCCRDHALVAQLRVVLHPRFGTDVDATGQCDQLRRGAVGTSHGRRAAGAGCRNVDHPWCMAQALANRCSLVQLALHLRGKRLPCLGQPECSGDLAHLVRCRLQIVDDHRRLAHFAQLLCQLGSARPLRRGCG
ncbi:hypothetical protein G6F24_016336 [Rhizopus arrhizus]|nr:hypothetical protein G6F24_016336 [Rhizopus arrhizus]